MPSPSWHRGAAQWQVWLDVNARELSKHWWTLLITVSIVTGVGCTTWSPSFLPSETGSSSPPTPAPASITQTPSEAMPSVPLEPDPLRLPRIDEPSQIQGERESLDRSEELFSVWVADDTIRLASAVDEELSTPEPWPNPPGRDVHVDVPELAPLSRADHTRTTYTDIFSVQWSGIRSDYAAFYSIEGLSWLTIGLGVGGLMANTGFDEHFLRDTYTENIVLVPSDELYEQLHQPKFLGDGTYTIPVFAIAALAEPLIDDLPLGQAAAEWGQRSLRTIVVGAPPMLALQVLTGGSRPGETSSGSHWRPFQDRNGVSGHSFMGAVPFLSAAMMTDNVWLKCGLYGASALPALSRVNDDNHYFSQAYLGWWLAYLAASAVDHSHDTAANHQFVVCPQADGLHFAFEYRH